jgi:hypothetical protein
MIAKARHRRRRQTLRDHESNPGLLPAVRVSRPGPRFARFGSLYRYAASWVSNPTEPKSCPEVRRTSALSAAASDRAQRGRGLVI